MTDEDDDVLAPYDLTACEPPRVPDDLADRVLARMRDVPAMPVVAAAEPVVTPRPRRALLGLGLGAAAAAAIVVVVLRGGETTTAAEGAAIADGARVIRLGATTAALDPGAEVHWRRVGRRVTASQRGGVTWTVAANDTLLLDADATGASVEAAGAHLRTEVEMNRYDKRLMTAIGGTAAATALLTVIVYEGRVAVTRAGQRETVAAGATWQLPAPMPTPTPSPPSPPIVVADHPLDRDGRDPEGIDPTLCSFPGLTVPADTQVLAAGRYEGRSLGFAIDRSGHEATVMEVAVTTPGPVALLLGAYEPTVWDLRWSPRTQIVAVIAMGYHRQTVAGLPWGTPVLTSFWDDGTPGGNGGACGDAHDPRADERTFAAVAHAALGRRLTATFAIPEGGVVTLGPPTREALTSSPAVTVASFRQGDVPRDTDTGIEQALASGTLRRATDAELEALRERIRTTPGRALRDRMSERVMERPLVLTRAFEFPAGMYGAASETFIVPVGVPSPTGDAGHSTVFDYNRPSLCEACE